MKKTKEQMYEKHQEVIERVLDALKNEFKDCKDFSCVISVNDGQQTGTMLYGSPTDLINNVTSIENNIGYVKVKEIKKMIEEF